MLSFDILFFLGNVGFKAAPKIISQTEFQSGVASAYIQNNLTNFSEGSADIWSFILLLLVDTGFMLIKTFSIFSFQLRIFNSWWRFDTLILSTFTYRIFISWVDLSNWVASKEYENSVITNDMSI